MPAPFALFLCLAAQASDPSASEMRWPIERFVADYGSLSRKWDVPLSPFSEDRIDRLYADTLKETEAEPFERMSQAGKVDYLLLANDLRHRRSNLELQRKKEAEMAPLLPFAPTIVALEESRRRMEPVDAVKAATTVDGLTTAIHSALADLDKAKASRTVAYRAMQACDRLRTSLKAWFDFYNGYDPAFSWWLAEPYKAADRALFEYREAVRDRLVGIKPDDTTTIIGDPIGTEALERELRFAMISYAPAEIVDIANREFAWCEGEMRKASREMGFGDDWKKALEKVKDDYVAPGEQPTLVSDLTREAIDFVRKRDLVTIPPLAEETIRMSMLSPEAQRQSPFFLGGEEIMVSYPTSTMSAEAKRMTMRGNNRHFARATVFHELIPGHRLQQFYNERYRPYRGEFYTPFWIEGNALYWEMRMWDLGFDRTPEDRIGALFWRMHRCARIIFSFGFHMGTMTPDQCVDFLVERVGHEYANAAAEVRRSFQGDYEPLYQAAYMLGALQLRALHHEAVDSGRMSEKAFNDAVLRENAIPIEMVRASLLGTPLTRDFHSTWRFGDEIPELSSHGTGATGEGG